MSTGTALTIRTAEAPGDPNKQSEDRIFTTDNAVILLDGATDREQRKYTGGWIAEQAGSRIQAALTHEPDIDLTDLVEAVIAELVDTYDLVPGQAPSTTVAILRVKPDGQLDAYVLADSPILLKTIAGDLIEVRDRQLEDVSTSIPRPNGLADFSQPAWRERHAAIEAHRNQPGGFWVISATPEAAHHASKWSGDINAIQGALLMSDGVSALGDHYDPGRWARDFDRYLLDPRLAISDATVCEKQDHTARRWPRSKLHDDKAVAAVT